MIKTSNLVLLVESVIQWIKFCGLCVIRNCIVGIDSKDLFGQTKLLQHLLEGVGHHNTCV